MAAAIFSVAALCGAFSPDLDLLTHFAPIYAGVAVMAVAFGMRAPPPARPATIATAAIALAACGALIGPEYLRDAGPRARVGTPGEIKIVQFNAARDNPKLKQAADWLGRENPDFALVEEASPALRNELVRRGWRVAGAGTTVMIFSHQPYLTMRRPPAALAPRLVWVNATYQSRSGPLEVVVTHFTWPTETDHAKQSEGMRRVLASLPRRRTILCGDFNSTPWSYARRADDAAFGLTRRDRGLASWPAETAGGRLLAPFPVLPIDHVYAGPGWATVDIRRGPRLGSDHYPLIAVLAPLP